MKAPSFKRDKYRSARGDYSRYIKILCRKCEARVAYYQKDGPGNLRRMYLDRIVAPRHLTNLQSKKISVLHNLTCTKCKELLAIPAMYAKENRKIFRLFQDAVIKKVVSARKVK